MRDLRASAAEHFADSLKSYSKMLKKCSKFVPLDGTVVKATRAQDRTLHDVWAIKREADLKKRLHQLQDDDEAMPLASSRSSVSAFRPHAYTGLTRPWAGGPANSQFCVMIYSF